MKRLFDIVVSLSALLFLFPLVVLIYIWVRYDSRGGAFFRQSRVGLNGKPFSILKFRTMTLKPQTDTGSFDAGDSSRITYVGRILRKYKLDELPQLINVLKGEMSIVGPRPEVRSWVDTYPERWRKIHQVKPGITDPASIEFRDEEVLLAQYHDPQAAYKNIILPRKLTLYEEYVENHSFVGDVKLIVKTVFKVVAN
ncbi:sugar transferase [Marinobacter sp. OP 3.4]|uniref:sugar transferase n=1 Tax=Marinobacter sp. OP 3.4 TaxID=3076501 RepID=UPI002E1B1851